MLKTLLRKQMTEIFRSYFYDAKKNKARTKKNTVVLLLLFGLVMIVVMGALFGFLSQYLCNAMAGAGLTWLYFALMTLAAILLGTFGSVFNTYAGLYLAKDNDLLLSMPIPVRYIMASRLLGVYLIGLMYSGVVILPAVIVSWFIMPVSPLAVVGGLLLVVVSSAIVLILSCALGWVVAKVSRKLKNKSIITVLIGLLCFGAYWFFYYNAQNMLTELVENSVLYGEKIRGAAYPLYLLGRMGEGDPAAILVWTLGTAVLLALTLYIIAHGFIRMATSSGSSDHAVYREKNVRTASPFGALRRREFARFLGSPTYILNCAMGALLGVILSVFLLIRNGWAHGLLATLFEGFDVPLVRFAPIAAALACMVLSSIAITAPSVSLEGKTVWLSQSLPVTPWQVLRAKLEVHVWIGSVPAILCGAATAVVLRLPVAAAVPAVLLPFLFNLLSAAFGLFLNLLHPNLTWVSEITPIKQSMSVMLALFAGWGYAALIGAGGFFLSAHVPTWAVLWIGSALTALLSLLLLRWLRSRGTRIFANL